MPKTTKVSQKKWIKGVNAAATTFAQPPGSFPRASNLVLTKRGGLFTCGGSFLLSAFNNGIFNGVPQPGNQGFGPITEIFLFQPTGLAAGYYAIIKDPTASVGGPAPVVVVDGGAGGVLNGNYTWFVTSLDGAGGESTPFNPVGTGAAIPAGHKASISWTARPFAMPPVFCKACLSSIPRS
jgi:hypothetical protein